MVWAESIIGAREAFEAALFLGIAYAYIRREKRADLEIGLAAGAGAALGVCALLWAGMGSLRPLFESSGELIEGILLLLAAAMMSAVVVGLFHKTMGKSGIERDTHQHARAGAGALALFAFATTLREGIEVVLMLAGLEAATGSVDALGASVGIGLGLLAAAAVSSALLRFDVGKMLGASALLLVVMAGGMVSQGVHELQEAGALPSMVEHVYDMNAPAPQGGPYPFWNEKGIGGTALKTLVGWDMDPSLEQLLAQVAYLGGMGVLVSWARENGPESGEQRSVRVSETRHPSERMRKNGGD